MDTGPVIVKIKAVHVILDGINLIVLHVMGLYYVLGRGLVIMAIVRVQRGGQAQIALYVTQVCGATSRDNVIVPLIPHFPVHATWVGYPQIVVNVILRIGVVLMGPAHLQITVHVLKDGWGIIVIFVIQACGVLVMATVLLELMERFRVRVKQHGRVKTVLSVIVQISVTD